MSTLPNSAVLFPDWKQEINRRVAAHKSARGGSSEAITASAPAHPLDARAAKAAARVAARFASAPSYSEMLAREARAAVDAAKAAAKAAEEAQAAFQFVLDGLEAVPAEPEWRPESLAGHTSEPVPVVLAPELLRAMPEPAIRADADQPTISAGLWESEALSQQDQSGAYDPAAYDIVRRHELPGIAEAEAAEPEEAVKPIHANLIEFPRPMVAARRARPRLAEGPLAASDAAPQLSIFEVDPAAISTAPPPATEDPSAPPSWMRTEWPELADGWQARDSHSTPLVRHSEPEVSAAKLEVSFAPIGVAAGVAEQPISGATTWEEFSPDFWSDDEAAARSASAPAIEVAPLSRRLLAVVVDGALSAAVLVFAAFVAVPHVGQLPNLRVAGSITLLGFLAAGLAYHTCFFTFFCATPGMRYAGIEIDTLSGSVPTRKRRWSRLLAMLLSLLPLGLGFLWALFDDNNLAWHDRLSGTYLRRR